MCNIMSRIILAAEAHVLNVRNMHRVTTFFKVSCLLVTKMPAKKNILIDVIFTGCSGSGKTRTCADLWKEIQLKMSKHLAFSSFTSQGAKW